MIINDQINSNSNINNNRHKLRLKLKPRLCYNTQRSNSINNNNN